MYDRRRRGDSGAGRHRESVVHGPDGVIEVPVSDLVAAGRLDPLAANAPHTEIVSKSRIERELLGLRAQLAVKMVMTDSFEGTLARADEEIKFWRGLLRERWAA